MIPQLTSDKRNESSKWYLTIPTMRFRFKIITYLLFFISHKQENGHFALWGFRPRFYRCSKQRFTSKRSVSAPLFIVTFFLFFIHEICSCNFSQHTFLSIIYNKLSLRLWFNFEESLKFWLLDYKICNKHFVGKKEKIFAVQNFRYVHRVLMLNVLK